MASNSPDESFESLDAVITDNYTYLVSNLRVFELMIGRHTFQGIISDEEENKIMGVEPEQKQRAAKLFLDAFLKSKHPGKGRVLKDALDGPGHKLVRQILFEGTEENEAHANEQKVLNHHRSLILKSITCDEMLISMCLSRNLITDSEAEQIRAKGNCFGDSRATIQLLDSLKKAQDFYSKFLKILWELGYKNLVKEIDEVEHDKLKARYEDGGSVSENALSFDSDRYSLDCFGSICNSPDCEVMSINTICPDVEKSETKDLNVFNIIPNNDLNGPVSSRTRSKTKLRTQDYLSRGIEGTGTSKTSDKISETREKTKLGFQCPPPITTTNKKVKSGTLSPTNFKRYGNRAAPITSKNYVDINDNTGTHSRSKQGLNQESSDEEEVTDDRPHNSEHRYPHDQQNDNMRHITENEQDFPHQAKAVNVAHEKVHKKQDILKTRSKCQCQCGEICRDDIQLEVHSKSAGCPLFNAVKKVATSTEIYSSKHTFGFQSRNISQSSHPELPSSRHQSSPPQRETPSHCHQSLPLPHVFRCKNCNKSFTTQQNLEFHKKKKTCVNPECKDQHHRILKHFGSTDKDEGASAENCRSATVRPSQRSPEVSQLTMESHRKPVIRCTCAKSFGHEDALKKHKTEGNCKDQKSSESGRNLGPLGYLNNRPVDVFRCNKCIKTFKNKEALKDHMQSHDSI